MITIKSRREFAKMQKAGAGVAAIHRVVRDAAAPGVSLLELEDLGASVIAAHGCTSSFLNYLGTYPATLCLSPNDVIVHGIPSDYRLQEGDILSVDAGAIYEGFHGDAAFTMPIGAVTPEAQHLIDTTEEGMWAGIDQVRKGNRLGDIGSAIAAVGAAHGYGVVDRADVQHRRTSHQGRQGWVDGQDEGRVPVCALGAHRRSHAGRSDGVHRCRAAGSSRGTGRLAIGLKSSRHDVSRGAGSR